MALHVSFVSKTFILMMMVVSACNSRHTPIEMQGDTLTLHHSTLLTIVECSDSVTFVHVADPWHEGNILHRYALVKGVNNVVPDEYTVVHVPLQRAVVFTSPHWALVDELKAMSQVCGVCDKQHINLSSVEQVPDFGSSMSPNIEMLVAACPDALLVSPFENGGYGQMEKLGIPIIECADYMEQSPLARAEWIRFYGLLFGVDTDTMFAQIEADYTALCRTSVGVSLFTDQLSGQAWYVPGGCSYLGRLYADAGADYVFAANQERGSVAFSFEYVFASACNADVWLIKYNSPTDLTLADLRRSYAPYCEFDAFKRNKVYGCNTGRVNYYEDVCFHPERLLRDIETILDGSDGKYYQRLKTGT